MDYITPDRALLTTRLLWLILLMGQGFLVFVIHFVWKNVAASDEPNSSAQILTSISIGTLLVVLPLAFAVRGHTYKKYWRGNAITPRGYLNGNLVFFILCEMVSLFALLNVMLQRTYWPYVIPAVIALLAQLINFPNGKAMEPAPPPEATKPR